MLDRLNKIINTPAQEVMQSPELYLELLKLYSILFLAGKQPSACEKCAYNYYNELKKKGIYRIKFIEMNKCKLQPNKIFHVRVGKAIITYSDKNMDDKTALRLLKEGKLKESDFVVLPEKPTRKKKTETKQAE